jgi:dCTP deaminase
MRRDREEHKEDPLIISPVPEPGMTEKSGMASVDLRLGTWFLVMRHTDVPALDLSNEVAEETLGTSHYVAFGRQFILHPGCFVLGVTLEWIRLPKDLAAYIVGRSTLGRRGLIIATAAGVHPTYTGCLTLELTNVGEVPVIIRPGMAICQLFIHTVQSDPDANFPPTYSCSRKPTLGKVAPDRIAKQLAQARDV